MLLALRSPLPPEWRAPNPLPSHVHGRASPGQELWVEMGLKGFWREGGTGSPTVVSYDSMQILPCLPGVSSLPGDPPLQMPSQIQVVTCASQRGGGVGGYKLEVLTTPFLGVVTRSAFTYKRDRIRNSQVEEVLRMSCGGSRGASVLSRGATVPKYPRICQLGSSLQPFPGGFMEASLHTLAGEITGLW